jgi:hypothetical protein
MQREITVKDTVVYLLLSLIIAFCVTITIKVYAMEEAVTEITPTTETTVQETTTEEVEETTDIPLTTVKYEDIPKFRELGRFYITGYTPTCTHCCGKSNCIGASGKKVIVGETVAMNRADMRNYGLEYGDKIYIEGIGERVIVDTGCEQGKVDVACDSHESCFAITGYYRVHYVIE